MMPLPPKHPYASSLEIKMNAHTGTHPLKLHARMRTNIKTVIGLISVKYPTYMKVNLARGKQTTQFGKSRWNPNNAVNGDLTGTIQGTHCTKTLKTRGSWWQVDLEAVYDIKLVVIRNRRDCCGKQNGWFGVDNTWTFLARMMTV